MNKKRGLISFAMILTIVTGGTIAYKLNDFAELESKNNLEKYEIIKEETGNENIMEINSKCLLAKDYKKIETLEEEADLIVVAELEEIEGCTNYNEKAKEYMMIHTLGTLKINKVFKIINVENTRNQNYSIVWFYHLFSIFFNSVYF